MSNSECSWLGRNWGTDEIVVAGVKQDHRWPDLPPAFWWNSIRIKTSSPNWSFIDQLFVDGILGGVCCFKLSASHRAPLIVLARDTPQEDHLKLLSLRYFACRVWRNCDLAVCGNHALELYRFHSVVPILIIACRTCADCRGSFLRRCGTRSLCLCRRIF